MEKHLPRCPQLPKTALFAPVLRKSLRSPSALSTTADVFLVIRVTGLAHQHHAATSRGDGAGGNATQEVSLLYLFPHHETFSWSLTDLP